MICGNFLCLSGMHLQSLLKCIQNQFAVERHRAVIDSLNLQQQDVEYGGNLQNQIEDKLLEDGVPAGIFNIGNTCYANAALQALLVCQPFTGYLVDQFNRIQGLVEQRQGLLGALQESASLHSNKSVPWLTVEFSQVVSSLLLLRSHNDSFSPSHLMTAVRKIYPQFAAGNQHDAQEFISCLLDRIHEELKYPIFQLSDETSEEDDGTASSTKSDYESCMSLVSEDSIMQLNGEEDSGMSNGISNGHGGVLDDDGDSTRDSTLCENTDEYMEPDSPDLPSSSLPPRSTKLVTFRSIIQDVFYGDFAVSIECKSCGEISTRYENFQMLEVSIPTAEQLAELSDNGFGEEVVVEEKPKEKANRWPKWLSLKTGHAKRRVGLMSCLRNEFRPEFLSGDNRYKCDGCKKETDAVKNIRISRLPEVLVIHFKRFKYDNSGAFLGAFTNPDRKIHDLVDFPCDELLDPSMFNMDFTTKYELRAVISHSGSTLSSGHYTCYVKMGARDNGAKWYMCNDADVTQVAGSVITDTEAYMLFYTQVDPEKNERLSQLSKSLRHLPPDGVGAEGWEGMSRRSQQVFPAAMFARLDQNVPLISKEWLSKLKWSSMIHRMSSQDLICPHRLLLPGILSRLPDLAVPVAPAAFETLVELYDGRQCRLLHRSECSLCAQLPPRPNSAGSRTRGTL